MNARVKKTFGAIHLWAGLIVGIPAAILGFTGIALMVAHPLPAEIGAVVPTDIDRTIAIARASAPEGAAVLQYVPPEGPGAPASVRVAGPRTPDNPRGFQTIEIDTEQGTILPPSVSPMGWQRIMHDLHGNLMVGGRGGRQLVGWVGVVMTLMGITGVVIWWPKAGKWREAFSVKTTGTTRRLLHDLHGAAGIWGLIVFVIVCLTGVVISFPAWFGAGGGGGPPGGPQREAQGTPSALELRVDAALAVAMQDRPGMGLIDVAMPRSAEDTYRFRIAPVGRDRAAPALTVMVDAAATKVQSVRDPATLPFGERLRAWSRQLHAGMAAGTIWWVLVLASGVLPVLFAISGTWLWLIKRRNKALVSVQQPAQ